MKSVYAVNECGNIVDSSWKKVEPRIGVHSECREFSAV
jgi:hypothetical protein